MEFPIKLHFDPIPRYRCIPHASSPTILAQLEYHAYCCERAYGLQTSSSASTKRCMGRQFDSKQHINRKIYSMAEDPRPGTCQIITPTILLIRVVSNYMVAAWEV